VSQLKHRWLAGFAVSTLLLVSSGFEAYHATGIVGTTRKNGYGCICHGFTPSPTVDVIVSGPDSLGVGQEGIYTVSVITDSNLAAGFNVAAFAGELFVGDSSEQQLMNGELTHTSEKYSGGSDTISWTFRYQAPDVSMFDTIYAAGNSVDMSLDPDGDFWNFSENLVIRVGSPVLVDDNFTVLLAHHSLLQSYPNPFNPEASIRFYVPQPSFVSLRVYDMLGHEVDRLVDRRVDAGYHVASFDGRNRPSGVYVYRLSSDGKSWSGKMVLLR
jgi:hypothetical protein